MNIITIEDLQKFAKESSVKGALAKELLEVNEDYKKGKIDFKTKDDLVKSIETGYHAEDACADEMTSRFLRQAVTMLLKIV